MAVTMREIAEEAGCDPSTVSRAIRGDPSIAPETREKIRAIARRLGYALDQVLDKRKGTIVGLVCPDPWVFFSGSYVPQILAGVTEVLNRYGCSVMILPRLESADDLHRDVGGLVIVWALRNTDVPIRELQSQHRPFVIVGNPTLEADDLQKDLMWIDVDHRQGAQDAVKYLVSLGHRRIAAIRGEPGRYASEQREQGYLDVLKEHDLTKFARVEGGVFMADEGERAMLRLLSLPEEERPTAVFAFSDTLALGAARAIRSNGLKIPDDISVVGFDNRQSAEYMVPPLSTIDHPVRDLGVRATELLVRAIEGKAEPGERLLLPARLVIRGSCKPLA